MKEIFFLTIFADFDNNSVGDIITGLDDDGDAGSAWFYPGDTSTGNYLVDRVYLTFIK